MGNGIARPESVGSISKPPHIQEQRDPAKQENVPFKRAETWTPKRVDSWLHNHLWPHAHPLVAADGVVKVVAKATRMDDGPGTPLAALQALMMGNVRFLKGELSHPHQSIQRVVDTSPHQDPFASILACADSRVPCEVVFDQGLGDVFVCRVAGNIATPDEIGSLEYSVTALGIKLIMVLGHSKCGACKAALQGHHLSSNMDHLLAGMQEAVFQVNSLPQVETEEQRLDDLVRINIQYQIENIRSASPIIADAENNGRVMLVGAYYDVCTGIVTLVDPTLSRDCMESIDSFTGKLAWV